MKLSISKKLSIAATILVVISVGITSWLFYTKTTEILVDEALRDISSQMQSTGSILTKRINKEAEDVLFLSGSEPVKGILRALRNNGYDTKESLKYEEWKERLEIIFTTMLGTKSTYLKIRLIDNKGNELVAATRNGNDGIIVNNNFQNKIKRKYVYETLKLPRDSIYLSEINLNREYGKISYPLQKVIRSASPIFDETKGEVAGLIVVTADMGALLEGIQQEVQDKSTKVYVTNDQGGYLLHPESKKEYGFDLGKRFRIQEDIPQLATKYIPDNKKQDEILLVNNNDVKHVVNITKLHFDEAHPERFVAVVITQLYSDIFQEQIKLLEGLVYLILAAAVVAIMLAMFFSHYLTKPIKQIINVMDDYIKGGSGRTEIPITTKDEIGTLAKNYQVLMERVEEAQQGLVNMNKGLEERVIERTEKLEQSERQQRSIVDNIADGLVTMSCNGLISSFNKAAIKIFGYDINEVIGRNIKMLMPSPYKNEHDGYLAAYLHTGTKKVIGSGVVVEGLRKDGSVFPMELAVSEMIVDGERIYTGVLRDITERMQIDKVKNDFVATVSHELRTPLTSIRGSLGLITGGALGDVSDNIQEMLLVAENNAQRLLLLINDILDMQKIEMGEISFYFDEVEISSLVSQSIESINVYGNELGIKFEFKTDLKEVYAYVDRDRMTQVMVNLLSNAVKFSPKGSAVIIRLFRDAESLCISVADIGPGIPEEFQPKLYDKFTQSDSSSTRAKGGTGLGLTICKAIIERHNGKLNYVTSETQGTVFTVEISEVEQSETCQKPDLLNG